MSAVDREWPYRCLGPTSWPSPPGRFSYSSVCRIENCPLQWQFAHAMYGDHQGYPARPSTAAAEGQIVHDVLESLFRKAAFAGLPKLGTPEFREVVSAVRPYDKVKELIRKHEDNLRGHPRGAQVRLKTPAQQIVNRAARLFRTEYPKAIASWGRSQPSGTTLRSPGAAEETRPQDLLDAVGAISDYELRHPRIPFAGIIDLVLRTEQGTVVVDFKTGMRNEEHKKQIMYYGVLWWRNTGEIPSRLEVRYLDGVDIMETTEEGLSACELEMEERISAVGDLVEKIPAEARIHKSCGYCDVRQFCDEYWSNQSEISSVKTSRPFVDVELVVTSIPTSNGFEGRTRGGSVIPVTHESGLEKVHGPFEKGGLVRISRGYVSSRGDSIELKVSTEVFHRGVAEVSGNQCPEALLKS